MVKKKNGGKDSEKKDAIEERRKKEEIKNRIKHLSKFSRKEIEEKARKFGGKQFAERAKKEPLWAIIKYVAIQEITRKYQNSVDKPVEDNNGKVEIQKRIKKLEKLPRKDIIAMVRRRGGPELADKAKREFGWAIKYLAEKEVAEKNQERNAKTAPPKSLYHEPPRRRSNKKHRREKRRGEQKTPEWQQQILNKPVPSPTLNAQTEPKVLMHGLNNGCEVKKEDFDIFAAKFGGRAKIQGYHSSYDIKGLDGFFSIQEFMDWIIKSREDLPEYSEVKDIFGPEYGPKIADEFKFALDTFREFLEQHSSREQSSPPITQPDDGSVV